MTSALFFYYGQENYAIIFLLLEFGVREMKPEEEARKKIDKQINNAGWNIVDRNAYIPGYSQAVREFLMQKNKESDYLFFIDNKAIAVLEAKKEDNQLGSDVAFQGEWYSSNPLKWAHPWFDNQIPLVYLANGKKILFKNMLNPNSEYQEIKKMHSPKEMLRLIKRDSRFGKLPMISSTGLRACQYDALTEFEDRLRRGEKKFLASLATGSGKTYLSCLIAYRQLAYTDTKRVLFLVDRNNLGKQAATEFSTFNRTENGLELSKIYDIRRLRNNKDLDGDPNIVISTIQKLYSYMTDQNLSEMSEDEEDEKLMQLDDEAGEAIELGSDLKLPHDYFQLIIVDECHRSIYGKWSNVLKYFNQAVIVGLTATPTPEAYAFFNKNLIANYSYEDSVVDGVNVPYDVYITKTEITEHGGTMQKGDRYVEITKKTGKSEIKETPDRYDFKPASVNRGVTVENQIDTILTQYRESVYSEMFTERKEDWRYIPKTLIFAKNDNHATEIIHSCERVFADKFESGEVPKGFAQKITYSSGDSDTLIQQFRTNKDFRIAVTVTLVSTGTDIKPLEVVMFMTDVKSSVLYQQMKGRGCRTISDSLLREVTPNADTKSRFILFDASGVTETDKTIPVGRKQGVKKLSLEQLLEQLSHGELTDENLLLLSDYCSSINQRYDNNTLLNYHIAEFMESFGFLPRTISESIVKAFDSKQLPAFNAKGDNSERLNLISKLMFNVKARNKLLELKEGYSIKTSNEDSVIHAGFNTEGVKSHLKYFEEYINRHTDDIEALNIIYNSGLNITRMMLNDLKQKLLEEDSSYAVPRLWSWYKMVDSNNSVGDPGSEANCLTNLIQIVRYGYKQSSQLVSISKYANSRFNLYAGQAQNTLTDDQLKLMKIIAEYVSINGVMDVKDFQIANMDVWRDLMRLFKNPINANNEILRMSKFILKAV